MLMSATLRYANLFAIVLLSAWALTALPVAMTGKRDSSLVDETLSDDKLLKAIEALTPEQIQSLSERETNAYLHAPLEFYALQNISILSGLTKNQARQMEISLLVPRFTKRNIAAQLAAANIYIGRSQYAQAFFHLDSMLRAHPEIGDDIFPLFSNLILQNKGTVELAQILKKDPPWRGPLFEYVISHEPLRRAGYAILSALRKEKATVRDSEIRSLVYALVHGKDLDQAYFVWLDFLPTQDLKLVGLVFDGNFERDAKNQIFDWTIDKRKNAKIAVEDRHGAAGNRNLALDFFQDSGVFNNIFQYLKLPSGKFQVSYDQMAQNFVTEGALAWQIRCYNGTVLGRGNKINASGPWATFGFDIEVPIQDCATQVLVLQSVSGAELDTHISGQLYFDNFKITPGTVPTPESQN